MADDNGRIPARPVLGGSTSVTPPNNGIGASSVPSVSRPAKAPAASPEVATSPAPAATRPAKPPAAPAAAEPKDSFREVIETVVFVVVLVLLLKSFAAEAFVIPTGSMAETLWGYQKVVECPRCHYQFPVNCSSEVDPQTGPRVAIVGATCPNCRHHIDNFAVEKERNPSWEMPTWNTGDRVLVAKFLYDTHLTKPQREEVVVFKYPREPQRDHVPMNYIKRCIGQPGETIGIYYGKLYVLDGLHYDDSQVKPEDLWRDTHMHQDDPEALNRFWEGKFRIVRKAPEHLLALRRIVYDNEHQDKDLPPRWKGEESWKPDSTAQPKRFTHAGGQKENLAWLRYQHLLREDPTKPQLITDFMGYNSYEPRRGGQQQPNWVGDLMLECEVTVEDPQGELVLELAKGVDRFQARWDLASGDCTLVRLTAGKEEKLENKPTNVKQKGTYRLRFANVDERLIVWVDSALPFGESVAYPPTSRSGPTRNDLQPANIGVKGAGVSVGKLRLWRDTYYTLEPGVADISSGWDGNRLRFPPATRDEPAHGAWAEDWSDPDKWDPLRRLPVKALYVQPGHYLCLGDNSPESSDGRSWGLVPERLLLGRALLIYYPFMRGGRIE